MGLTVTYSIVTHSRGHHRPGDQNRAERPSSSRDDLYRHLADLSYEAGRGETEGAGMAETILIVDDEVEILELLELIITDRTAYQVVTSNNSLEVPGST